MMTEVIISDFHCDILPMWNFYRQKYWFGFVITTIAGFYLTLELTDNRWWMKSQSLVDDVSVSVFVWLCTIFAPSGAAGVCEHSSHTIWVVPNVRSGMENLTMGGLHHPAPIVEVVQEVCTTPGALCPGFNCKEREVAKSSWRQCRRCPGGFGTGTGIHRFLLTQWNRGLSFSLMC